MSRNRQPVERLKPPSGLVRLINPLVRRLLTSPVHGLLSRQLVLLEFEGRRSGRRYAVPAGKRELDGRLCVFTDSGWRVNFRGGRSCTVVLGGDAVPAVGRLEERPDRIAAVYGHMIDELGSKAAQRRLGIRVNVARPPTRAELVDLVERTGLSILELDTHPDGA